MPRICLHFEKTVIGCQYGYHMKGLDVGVKNMSFVDQFCYLRGMIAADLYTFCIFWIIFFTELKKD